MDHRQLSHALADAFNALADEVQLLADRKTVLEHKLRFAHEQFQYLADKYAPATPEIAETLAKLQLPPHTAVDSTSPVPLPHRASPQSQHRLALVIRDGRRAASRLVSLGESSKTAVSSKETSQTSRRGTSVSTALEQDFTVQGKKGSLECPFSKTPAEGEEPDGRGDVPDETPHHSHDPICAAMYEESTSQPAPSAAGASKCPIRFMDKHSPEEIAHYVETHKHVLPRSHEVCLRRYQKNELQMRKLDSKYGNIVSMIEGLSHLHQPMLPEEEQSLQHRSDVDGASIKRVESWAQDVSATAESDASRQEPHGQLVERQGHFDRPLKEVRVGESPSRPWGISVPAYEMSGHETEAMASPPPAPVRMTSPARSMRMTSSGPKKCPFAHAKLAALNDRVSAPRPNREAPAGPRTLRDPPVTPEKPPTGRPSSPPPMPQPHFINPGASKEGAGGPPQMVFAGPVFIGYPMEQAVQFMNLYRGNQ
ncbi:hypothetical protein DCS_05252 [Drechmeria coniospora]|uniref:Uncharacterized protein n=1 Tax=Drechmeria coniospora TaxID=98403 RepID=A0A151GMA3_DRECN|nr:hypothetical protein DCS_05252 [Drechmeria coniospora]KYK58239.1 hypothetical protein DCS_05252 [Drechmeria coniospora]